MRIDIFCKVVDNYGDAGFCWRLARRLTEILANHHFTVSGHNIRLFCDDLSLIHQLAGKTTLSNLSQLGLELHPWQVSEAMILTDDVPDLVLETFSCDLPEHYITQITNSLLINVEYLSAEPWVEDMHGLATLANDSKQAKRYFYYPGFNEKTGGLLGKTEQSHLLCTPSHIIDDLFQQTRPSSTKISVFNYGDQKLIDFLNQLIELDTKVDLFICSGKPQTAIARWLHQAFTETIDVGQMRLIPTPFMPQDEYDKLLAYCDLNWVRGEDSFIRAQWAAKPFIWDIYPQEDLVHLEKLDAFLNIYLPKNNLGLTEKTRKMMTNQSVNEWWDGLSSIRQHALDWQNTLATRQLDGDLGDRLLKFAKPLLKKG